MEQIRQVMKQMISISEDELNDFLGQTSTKSSNAIKTQIYCVLMAQLLMVVIRKNAATKKSFANIITVPITLMSYVELLHFIKDTYKAWRRSMIYPLIFPHKKGGELPHILKQQQKTLKPTTD